MGLLAGRPVRMLTFGFGKVGTGRALPPLIMLLTILVILLVLALVGGVFGGSRGWGYYGWSPVGLILIILLVLWLTGALAV
jgi:hypothetical protein